MSEYNPYDHLHNVSDTVMQITRQAQSITDIVGAEASDYSPVTPEVSRTITVVDAKMDILYIALINTLPPVRLGSGVPSFQNIRPLNTYTKSIIYNGDDERVEMRLPERMYGGSVDYQQGKITSDIIRVRVPADVNWLRTNAPNTYYVSSEAIPEDDRLHQYAAGENYNCQYISGATNIPEQCVGLINSTNQSYYPGRLYINVGENAEVTDNNTLKAWLEENPIYIYYRVRYPVITSISGSMLYVPNNNYALSAEYGTITVSYMGIDNADSANNRLALNSIKNNEEENGNARE